MPKGPQGQKRPADVIGNAVHVMRIATGEIEETTTADGKNAAAVALGRMGGKARAKKLSKKRRSQISKNAADLRWAARTKD
jgi:2-keto-3-deoxy-6-phosphogluconate aldolase